MRFYPLAILLLKIKNSCGLDNFFDFRILSSCFFPSFYCMSTFVSLRYIFKYLVGLELNSWQ